MKKPEKRRYNNTAWIERRREYLQAIGRRELVLIDRNGRRIRVAVVKVIETK